MMNLHRHSHFAMCCLAFVACLLASCVARAAVTITGQVDPADPLTWVGLYTDHHIGKSANGEVIVDGGSDLSSSVRMHIGFEAGVTGSVAVTGFGSTWAHNGTLYLGRSGSGNLNIQNGGVVDSFYSYLGYNTGSSGSATVTGPGSQWNNDGLLEVGYYGTGALTIQDGATVSSASGGLADTGGSSAVVTVTGADSRWDMSEQLSVGGGGPGELKILGGASVTVGTETSVGAVNGSRIIFDQGTLQTESLLAGVSQLRGVGTIYTRGLVTDVALTFDASHGLEQQVLLETLPDQDITIHLDMAAAASRRYVGAGYKAAGSLTVADGVEINSWGGYLGYHAGSQGTATVTGSGSVWASQQFLMVGNQGTGTLVIQEGAKVSSFSSTIGAGGGSVGSATINGADSLFDIAGELAVGSSGKGTLTVENGATASNSVGYVGYQTGSNGVANVTGAGSTWINRGALQVGSSGVGAMTISDGAAVSNTTGTIGFGYSSSGIVTVTGAGSTWSNSSHMTVGVGGAATLNVLNGGVVNNINGDINGRGAPECVALVSGDGSAWVNGGNLRVGPAGKGTLTITDGGLVSVGSGGGSGDVTIGGATANNGTIHLQDRGVLRLHGGKVNGTGAAAFNFNGGRLEGVGTYQVGAGLTQNGGVLAPGNSAGVTTIAGSYALNEGALEIELLSSGAAGVGFDQLVVNSGVMLGADSQLDLLLGYAANVGDSFLIVDSKKADPINGTFANDDALTADFESLRYSFALSYTAGTGNDIALTVASVALIGDYNADGFVDAADYTVWRDAAGTSVAAYAGADGNGDGVVDDGDHAVWAAHYGASLETAMARAVPEPSAGVLVVLALAAGGCRRLGSRRLDSAS